MGDWMGREAKRGQAWLTYLSSNEWVELQYVTKKTPNNFIAGGVTQNSFPVKTAIRFGRDVKT